jgi:hypothetical protein
MNDWHVPLWVSAPRDGAPSEVWVQLPLELITPGRHFMEHPADQFTYYRGLSGAVHASSGTVVDYPSAYGWVEVL